MIPSQEDPAIQASIVSILFHEAIFLVLSTFWMLHMAFEALQNLVDVCVLVLIGHSFCLKHGRNQLRPSVSRRC